MLILNIYCLWGEYLISHLKCQTLYQAWLNAVSIKSHTTSQFPAKIIKYGDLIWENEVSTGLFIMNLNRLLFLVAVLALILFSAVYCTPAVTDVPNNPSTENVSQTENQRAANKPGTKIPADIDAMQSLKLEDPAKVDNTGFPITPVEKLHPINSTPTVDMAQYKLSIEGLVEKQFSLSYEEIKNYPAVTETVLLICPGFFVDNAEWTGVEVKTLLDQVGVKEGATKVRFNGIDGYGRTLTLEEIQGEGILLAYIVNGQTLPADHGYPLRLVAKGKYGSLWIKWLKSLEVQK
jgi:hypothetical protein